MNANHVSKKMPRWTGGAVFIIAAWCALRAAAQLTIGTVEGFDANEYYPAPDNTKLRWRITGAKAEPRDRAVVLLTDMKLRTLRLNGAAELSVDAPQCFYDSAKRTANSPGKLKVLVNDGQFVIEGEGFHWQMTQETNWTLIISNRVAATVQRPTTNAAPAFMTIAAHRFAFDTVQRQAVFSEGVLAEDAEIEMRCEILSTTLEVTNSTPDWLKMERQVSVLSKQEQMSANADLAIYLRTNESLTLTGNVSWQQGEKRGRAERVLLRRREKEFAADGQVAVQLPRGALGLGGLLRDNTNAVSNVTTAAPPIQLSAAHLLVRSNFTLIEGDVRIQDATNRISCAKIVSETAGPEQTAVAEGGVIVCHGSEDQCLRAERAVYTKSTGAAVFTGQPTWKLDQSEGRADQITLRDAGEIQAVGNVAARVTLAGQSNTFLNVFPAPASTNAPAQALELFSRTLTANRSLVTLAGDARVHQSPITGHEPHLHCETLALRFATNSSHVQQMEAKDNVRFEQGVAGVTNGPDAYSLLTANQLTATCAPTNGALEQLVAEGTVVAQQPGSEARAARVTYTAANQTLVLTGEPTLRTLEANVTGAEQISWDRKNNRVTAKGQFDGSAQTGKLQEKLNPTKPTKP